MLISKLKEFRESLGITRLELGEILGVNQATIYRLEEGKTKKPLAEWKEIADMMGCSVTDICENNDKKRMRRKYGEK